VPLSVIERTVSFGAPAPPSMLQFSGLSASAVASELVQIWMRSGASSLVLTISPLVQAALARTTSAKPRAVSARRTTFATLPSDLPAGV